MVRCYICDERCEDDDGAFVCEHCGCCCHLHCMADYGTDVCPKCVGEPTIGTIEF